MMKKVFAVLIIAAVIVVGCSKNDTKCAYIDSTIKAPKTEVDSLRHLLLDTLHITASQDSTGFFYNITNNGSGGFINNLCNNVTVTYKGTFFNGQGFDSTASGSSTTFQLGQVIVGWQKGLPLINKGGDITLYIPPSLAYGSKIVKDPTTGNVVIPANSYLIFKIHLADVQ